MTSNHTRSEHDSLGAVAVPADRYWGAQTERARHNFAIGDALMPRAIIKALAVVKIAAARCNVRFGKLDAELAEAIERAAGEVVDERLAAHFPLTVWQSGSGTQSNMNVNEVLANRGNELLGKALGSHAPIHPNDHVNMSQSTNDVFPTAMAIAVSAAAEDQLLPAVAALAESLRHHAERYRDVVKIGRTHLMDATPLTVGRELSSFAAQLEHASDAVRASLPRVRDIPIGGTAVGSGLNAPAGWDGAMCEVLGALTGTSFTPAADKLACQAAHDAFVNHHGTLKTLACALVKLANDIRWLASGPRAGLGELRLPANEPGSSIMPGKVNPTQCEAMLMVCARVFGNDATMTFAGASGELQLNVYKPLIAQCCLESLGLLSDAIRSMTERLVAGLEVNEQRLASQVERSLMLVTALAPRIGYERAAELAQRALRDDKTLRDVVLDGTDMSAQELDALIRSMAV